MFNTADKSVSNDVFGGDNKMKDMYGKAGLPGHGIPGDPIVKNQYPVGTVVDVYAGFGSTDTDLNTPVVHGEVVGHSGKHISVRFSNHAGVLTDTNRSKQAFFDVRTFRVVVCAPVSSVSLDSIFRKVA